MIIPLIIGTLVGMFSISLSITVYERSRRKYNELSDYLFTFTMWMFTIILLTLGLFF